MPSMSLSELKKCVELSFNGSEDIPQGLDATVLLHANNYFLTASAIYASLGDEDLDYSSVYPLLTLLGFSAELFLKGFHINVVDEVYTGGGRRNDAYSSLGKNLGTLLSKGKVKTLNKPDKNGHHLGNLLKHYLTYNKNLHDYLVLSYHRDTERHLEQDLEHYSNIFKHVRYIFEYKECLGKSYSSDLTIVFRLVESLYNSVNSLYKD